jgi:hypothetical protein
VKPRKMELYLAEGARLAEVVNAYRAAKGEASAEDAAVTQRTYVSPDCDKPRPYKQPPLDRPTEIPGYPLNNPSPGQEIPDYVTIGRVKAMRATQAARRGKRAPVAPSGSPALRKRHDMRTWKVAE